jgi:hypothetical protein
MPIEADDSPNPARRNCLRAALMAVGGAVISSASAQSPGAAGKRKRPMMNIELEFASTTPVARHAGAVPVLAITSPVHLTIRFANVATTPLKIESPRTSQDLLLWLIGPSGESWTMLNPSSIDATGEITAPMPVQIVLQPGERFEMEAELGRDIADRWFGAGVYAVYVSYAGVQSNRLRFGTELRAESVPPLVEMALAGRDAWFREQAMALLKQIPGGPDLALPRAGADAAEKAAGQARNIEIAERFLSDWERLKQTAEVLAFFESVQVVVEGGV